MADYKIRCFITDFFFEPSLVLSRAVYAMLSHQRYSLRFYHHWLLNQSLSENINGPSRWCCGYNNFKLSSDSLQLAKSLIAKNI